MLSALLLSLISQCSCPCPDAGVVADAGVVVDAGETPDAGSQPVNNSPGCGKTPPTLVNGAITLKVNGVNRTANINVPVGYNKNVPLAFTSGWHGMQWTGYALSINEPFVMAASGGKSIFAFPNSSGSTWDLSPTGSDVAFFDVLSFWVLNNYCVDTTKQFAYGRSYGGGFVKTLMTARASQLRAVAMVVPWLPNASSGTDAISTFIAPNTQDNVVGVSNARVARDYQSQLNACVSQTPVIPTQYNQSITTTYQCVKKSLVYVESNPGMQHNPFPGLGVPIWNFFLNAP